MFKVARLLVASALALTALAATPAEAANPRPFTVPAVHSWSGGTGTLLLARTARVVVAPGDGALLAAAADLARDLRVAGVRTGAARAGDVVLDLTSERGLGAEGYRLTVGRTVVVSAPTVAGVFYGTQTLRQLAKQSARLPVGTARDVPSYPFRGVMLDAGRKFWTLPWLKALLDDMAALKLNVFHFHFSDNEGFRVASDRHPEIVSEEHLTKAQVRDLVAYAARRHITVVPEIDNPGHLTRVLATRPELQLTDALGRKSAANLDFTNPKARAFIRDLIEEYLPLFPGRWWHLGGDEVVLTSAQWAQFPGVGAWAKQRYGPSATPEDAFYDYVNWLAGVMRAHGKTPRIWSGQTGGAVVRLQPWIVNEIWHAAPDFATADQLAANGNAVLNCMFYPTYYVVSPHWYARPENKVMKTWYEQWTPTRFDNDVEMPLPTYMSRTSKLEGGKFHVWADSPGFLTQEQVAVDIAPRLRIMAQKVWGSPLVEPTWLGFADRSATLP